MCCVKITYIHDSVLQCSCLQNMQDVQIIFVNKTLHTKDLTVLNVANHFMLIYFHSHTFFHIYYFDIGLFREAVCEK